jgi:hypothetical protein
LQRSLEAIRLTDHRGKGEERGNERRGESKNLDGEEGVDDAVGGPAERQEDSRLNLSPEVREGEEEEG